LTKRFLAASATTVVTTKMIKTRRKVRETPTLIVMLAASLGDAVGEPGDTCLPWATGVWGEQPSRNRVDDYKWPRIRRGTPLLVLELVPGKQLVLIIVAAGGGHAGWGSSLGYLALILDLSSSTRVGNAQPAPPVHWRYRVPDVCRRTARSRSPSDAERELARLRIRVMTA
jgi:hypothetical protein